MFTQNVYFLYGIPTGRTVEKKITKYFLRDYVAIATVIILVTMATPISSNMKDKNSIFTACDEDMIF